MQQKIFGFISKKMAAIAAAVILVLIIGILIFKNGNGEINTVKAKLGSVEEVVIVSGKTKPSEEVSLAFEQSGRVTIVGADVGSHVLAGQILLSQDDSVFFAQLKEAEANLASQKSKLEELRRGPREEEIEIKRSEVAKAEIDLANDYSSVPDVLQDAYGNADIAIHDTIDDLFENDEYPNVALTFSVSDAQIKIDSENGRYKAELDLKLWKNSLDSLPTITDKTAYDATLKSSLSELTAIRNFLNTLMSATLSAAGTPTSTINANKTAVTTARGSITDSITAINNQVSTIASAEGTVSRLKNELNLKLAGTDPQQISAQEAMVKQAEAGVARINASIAKTRLKSPINGLVTVQEAKRGEIVTANMELVSVISDGKMEIEANISELDLGKIKLGNPVKISFDAYPNKLFSGQVTHIDPAETIVDGAVNYKVKIAINEQDGDTIKSGLTVNLEIQTNKRENVIIVPQRALNSSGAGYFLKIIDENNVEKTADVVMGVKGNDGNVEILSGVNDGDIIVVGSSSVKN